MNIHLYICLQCTVRHQGLDVTVESVPYDVMVYAEMTVKRNVVSVTLHTSGIVDGGKCTHKLELMYNITICTLPVRNRKSAH